MIELDVRIQASVTGDDAYELDAWWLEARLTQKLPTLDALACWTQQHGW